MQPDRRRRHAHHQAGRGLLRRSCVLRCGRTRLRAGRAAAISVPPAGSAAGGRGHAYPHSPYLTALTEKTKPPLTVPLGPRRRESGLHPQGCHEGSCASATTRTNGSRDYRRIAPFQDAAASLPMDQPTTASAPPRNKNPTNKMAKPRPPATGTADAISIGKKP